MAPFPGARQLQMGVRESPVQASGGLQVGPVGEVVGSSFDQPERFLDAHGARVYSWRPVKSHRDHQAN